MSEKRKRHDKFSPLTAMMLVILSIYCVALIFMLFWAIMQIFKFPLDFNKNPIWFPSNAKGQNGFTVVNFKILAAYTQTEWMPVTAKNPSVSLVQVFINSMVYALGGSLVNKERTKKVNRVAYWEDEDLIHKLEEDLRVYTDSKLRK